MPSPALAIEHKAIGAGHRAVAATLALRVLVGAEAYRLFSDHPKGGGEAHANESGNFLRLPDTSHGTVARQSEAMQHKYLLRFRVIALRHDRESFYRKGRGLMRDGLHFGAVGQLRQNGFPEPCERKVIPVVHTGSAGRRR